LGEEKSLLKSAFGQISQKYEALISQVQNQHLELTNYQNAEINRIKSETGDRKDDIFQTHEKLIDKVKSDNQLEKENAVNDVNGIIEKINAFKRKKSELKHQVFYTSEIEKSKEDQKAIEIEISNSNSIILNSKNEVNTLRKQWELEEKEMERSTELKVDEVNKEKQKYSNQIQSIENKIAQSKSSFYGWLNDTVPNWEETIGKVIDEESVLFNSQLNPKLVNTNSDTFFG